MRLYTPAEQPAMYFIGVTTKQSSIMKVFPVWAERLGFADAVIKGIDLPIHAPKELYREAVSFIKNDPLSLGALVTTHKIDLYNACRDMFEYIDPYADMLGEISSISKDGDRLCGYAKDPISSGLSMEAFVPGRFWRDHGGEVLLLGAGGASLAMAVYLTDPRHGDNMPSKIIITNRSEPRLEAARKKLAGCAERVKFEFIHNPLPQQNDAAMEALKPYSLIVNATGLGKDAPGSPITDAGNFPKNSLVWEINYRGELDFMHQSLRQKDIKNLVIEDGWTYFLHGWTQVISEVFHINISEEKFKELDEAAKSFQAIKK